MWFYEFLCECHILITHTYTSYNHITKISISISLRNISVFIHYIRNDYKYFKKNHESDSPKFSVPMTNKMYKPSLLRSCCAIECIILRPQRSCTAYCRLWSKYWRFCTCMLDTILLHLDGEVDELVKIVLTWSTISFISVIQAVFFYFILSCKI